MEIPDTILLQLTVDYEAYKRGDAVRLNRTEAVALIVSGGAIPFDRALRSKIATFRSSPAPLKRRAHFERSNRPLRDYSY